MSFESLQNAYGLQMPTPPTSGDPTRDILEQGKNFAREMAGERGIMAAIESAHLRKPIMNYIKNKVLTSDNPLRTISNDVQAVRNRASNILQQGRDVVERANTGIRGLSDAMPQDLPPITENKVLAGRPETQEPLTSTIETEAPIRNLRGDPNVGRPPLPETGEAQEVSGLTGERLIGTQAEREATRRAAIQAAEEDPVSFGKAPAGSIGGPESSPFLRGAPTVERGITDEMPFEALFRNPPISSEEFGAGARSVGGRIISKAPQSAIEQLPQAEQEAIAARRAAIQARQEGERLIEPTPAPRVPVLPQPEETPPPPAQVRAIPKPQPEASGPTASTPASRPITAEDFPSVPKPTSQVLPESDVPEWSGPPPPPARPAIQQEETEPVDEYGLPKAPEPKAPEPKEPEPKEPEPKDPEPSGADEDAGRIAQEESDKALADQMAKTTATEAGEEAVPGVGDILALGTAIYGMIKSGVEAHKQAKEAEEYQPPAQPNVAMDSSPTFDSTFRGGN